jgi:hypothetical protein
MAYEAMFATEVPHCLPQISCMRAIDNCMVYILYSTTQNTGFQHFHLVRHFISLCCKGHYGQHAIQKPSPFEGQADSKVSSKLGITHLFFGSNLQSSLDHVN